MKRAVGLAVDATGNWNDYLQKGNGTIALDQDRMHNHANEIDVDDG